MSWIDPVVVLWVFAIAFTSDLARAGFELIVNFRYRHRRPTTIPLGPASVAVVVPCHDGGDSIRETIATLPRDITVYCVANNCSDDTVGVVRDLAETRPGLVLLDVDFVGKSKTKAVLLGAVQAARDGHSHFLLVDDDIAWPSGMPIAVLDRDTAITALPLMPRREGSVLERFQVFEYIGTNLNKRCQAHFGRNVTWASGAAAVYRLDVFLDVMRAHDGEFAGEDVQCSYLHHYRGFRIDFLQGTMVTTDVPRTMAEWWRQRAHSWDVSFMFLHLGLLLRVLFRRRGLGPGWWIRLMTFYRIYDALLVVVKLTLPLAIIRAPAVVLFFVVSSYLILAAQYFSYPVFFPRTGMRWGSRHGLVTAATFAAYPVYTFVIWMSRLMAVPHVVYRKLNPRPLLGPFIDQGFRACTRVASAGEPVIAARHSA